MRLSILRFPLIVGVVFIHNADLAARFSSGSLGSTDGGGIAVFFRNLISSGVARTAVPLFFLMSGYLFFLGVEWTRDNYIAKLKSRVRTLLIPFLLWNTATLAVIAVVQALPATRHYLSGAKAEISSYEIYGYFDAIFGIDRMPISYQFWFIRDLMVLCILAPFIHYLVSKLPFLTLGCLGASWFLGVWPVAVPSSEAALFFAIGTAVAVPEQSLFRFDRHSNTIYLIYLVVLSLDMFSIGTAWGQYIHRFGVLFGVLSLLCLTRLIVASRKVSQFLLALSSASFFVFAAHEPMLTIVKKIAFQLIHPNAAATFFALYLLIPLILVFILVEVYKHCSRWFPRFTSVIVGGR
ncbi:MAG: acyltransferase [Aeromicrobium sp.]|nr:acyltransferase [Burkholderiales bacterium]